LRHNSFNIMAKTELFNKNLQLTASFFKALGHPARLAILKYIAGSKVCITGDISNELPLSRTTVNQHLQELKKLKLIKGEIEGAKVNYCLNSTVISKVLAVLEGFFKDIDCCKNLKCK
jgi:ArsR family transcriptional regulator, arsenate/arsenite/antimonite-responsive transcriptional repressor